MGCGGARDRKNGLIVWMCTKQSDWITSACYEVRDAKVSAARALLLCRPVNAIIWGKRFYRNWWLFCTILTTCRRLFLRRKQNQDHDLGKGDWQDPCQLNSGVVKQRPGTLCRNKTGKLEGVKKRGEGAVKNRTALEPGTSV